MEEQWEDDNPFTANAHNIAVHFYYKDMTSLEHQICYDTAKPDFLWPRLEFKETKFVNE